ncbi:MAG: radical SAM protein [Proteobacteria bacterium]|nr:radical SAM protein [Pseudomonadota bacterium]
MKCALIVPAWAPEEIFSAGTAGSQINYWQPLGLLYLAASLTRAGHQVAFFDGAFLSQEQILRRVTVWAPDFAGIYATTFGWPKAVATATALKRAAPRLYLCVGGPYPTAMREACLRGAGVSFDAVVAGEGEVTVVELLERLAYGRSAAGVSGVIYRTGDNIVCNPPRPLIEDLDALPFPARELLGDRRAYIPPPATYRRQPVATLLTSRGCNRRCLFCYQPDRERRGGRDGVRYRSIDNVLQEIELCLAQGYCEIKFLDDSLAADYDRAMRLAQTIKARRLDFTWFASACVNQVDLPLLQAFKAAGCWAILLGAESGVQKNLNTLRKGTTLAQIRRAVAAAKLAGLRVSTPFLFGIPGETFTEGLQTIDFALELDPDLANFHALTPFPGTPLYEQAAQLGSVSADLADYTYQGAAFVPHSMSREEILRLRQLALRRFYSRPKFIARHLLALRNWNDCKAALAGARSLFWLWLGGKPARRGVAKAARIRAAAPDIGAD